MRENSLSNIDIRANNKKRLIHLLFRTGQMSRQEIAQKLGISQPTIATIIKEYTNAGLIEDGEIQDSTGGRKAQCHRPVLDAKYSMGVDVSGDSMRCAVINLGNTILAQKNYKIDFSYTDSCWMKMNELIHSFIDEFNINESKLLRIGITLDVPMRDNEIVFENERYADIDLGRAETFFDFPIVFRNNAKMAAVAQVWGAIERHNFIFVRLAKTVQGAMMYDGVPIDFAKINCEFGLLKSDINDGRNLNDELSYDALFATAGVSSSDEFFEKLEAGDKACEAAAEKYVNAVAVLIYNLHAIFGWEVVLGGRMSQLIERYRAEITEKLNKYYYLAKPDNILFSISEFGALDASVGIAMSSIDSYLNNL